MAFLLLHNYTDFILNNIVVLLIKNNIILNYFELIIMTEVLSH